MSNANLTRAKGRFNAPFGVRSASCVAPTFLGSLTPDGLTDPILVSR